MGHDELDQVSDPEIQVNSLRPSTSAETSSEKIASRPLFGPVRSRQQRMRRGIAITSMLALVLAALILSITPAREAVRGVVFGPTSTATAPIPAGEDSLYIALNPHWGSLLLDNHVLTRLPAEGRDQPLHLARGRHVLRWQVASVIDYSCQFTVPSAGSDSCPMRDGIQPERQGPARVAIIRLSLKILSPTSRESLIAAMQAALDAQQSSEIIRPGEHYWSEPEVLTPAIADQPLRATLRFVLDAENPAAQCAAAQGSLGADCMMDGDCRELCTDPSRIESGVASRIWQAYIVARAVWHVTTLDGRAVAADHPDSDGYLSYLGADEHPIPIAIGWDGSQWHVSVAITGAGAAFSHNGLGVPFSPVGCLAAQDAVALHEIYQPEMPATTGAVWLYVSGNPIAAGCLAAAVPLDAQGAPDTSARGLASAGLILHRFGVELAANAAAQRYWPDLPVADAHEQAIAQALAQQLPEAVGR
ncbi:MAG TPA: hypothetical protein VFU63_11070 [Ktedonobacterales bacterium]|nr:hypothetical protein [Ktedonobacterales bacterium]